MRKISVIFLVFLSVLLVACADSGIIPQPVDNGVTEGDTESSLENDVPRFEPSPTPPLPPTFTPSAMAHQGHLYLLPVSGADGSIQYAYKVRAGDNLTSISTMYGVSVKDVMLINNLTDANHIEVGELLIIPIDG